MELVWEEDGRKNSVDLGPSHPEVMLGRHKDCEIYVNRPTVSRRHALFSWNGGQVTVTDQQSTAGTFIDGRKIERARLSVGTEVNCGGVIVVLSEGAARSTGRGRAAPEPEPPPSRRAPPAREPEPPAPAPSRRSVDDLDALFDDPPPSRRSRGGDAGAQRPERPSRANPEDFFSPSAPEPLPEPSRGRGGARAPVDDFFSSSVPEPLPEPEPPRSERGGGGGRGAGGGRAGFDPDAFFGSDDGFDDWKPTPSREPEPEPEPEPAPAPAPVRGTPHMACYLLYVDDDGREAEAHVPRDGDPVLVGRRAGATIKVHNASVSGKHCTIGWADEQVVVRDLGSSNGTFINNERVRRGVVEDGDVIRCGRFDLRVSFVAHKAVADAEYEEWGDDEDWGDDQDMGPPRYHLIWMSDRRELTSVTMGENERLLAVGSQGCEVSIETRDVEPEHCELAWDEGVLVVTDLRSETGTFVNDESIEDESVRNGDVLVVGRARIHIVRGCSSERKPPSPEYRSEQADVWIRHLDSRTEDLEILFIDGEEHDEGGKHELSIWGNGESRLEIISDAPKVSVTGTVDRDLRRLIYESLARAGFPDTPKNKVRAGEVPPEINLFERRDEARVVLSKSLVQRSPGYHEVLEVLRAVCAEMAAS